VLEREDCDPLPAHLYEALLPFLSEQQRTAQLAQQLSTSDGVEEGQPVPDNNGTLVHTVLGALSLALKLSCKGTDDDRASWTILLLQWEGLRRAAEKVALSAQHGRQAIVCARLVRDACCSLARLGSLQSARKEWQAHMLERLHEWLDYHVNEAAEVSINMKIPPQAPRHWSVANESCRYSGLERLTEEAKAGSNVGQVTRPDVVLPVLCVFEKQKVESYDEAVVVVQQCAHTCTMLVNQRSRKEDSGNSQRRLLPHADLRLVALVQHLFMMVLPVPQPSDDCFWRRSRMALETQLVLVSEIGQLMRQFIATALSLPSTTHLHGVRMLTTAAAVAVIDAVIRNKPRHGGVSPSYLTRIYTGKLTKDEALECSAFELADLSLVEDTQDLIFADPNIAQLRTGVLDYFAASKGHHFIFGFKGMRLDDGDVQFLHRLSLLRGFQRGSIADRAHLSSCLAGKIPQFLATYPGLVTLRDLTFLLRLLCLPQNLPERKRETWHASDVELRWEYLASDDRFRVVGFQNRELTLEPGSKEFVYGGSDFVSLAPVGEATSGKTDSFFSGFKRFTAMFSGGESVRRSLSPALPSNLAGCPIESEDDVLHIETLPRFDDRLSPMQSEHLLSILTVPYLRIPLVLRFFNDRTHFSALGCPVLQAMLDAVLFEPGPFLESDDEIETDTVADQNVPGVKQHALRTPSGRLCHELTHSPGTILAELDGLFRLAVEVDIPSYSAEASASLYTIRLWARIAAFTSEVCQCSANTSASKVRGFGDASKHVVSELAMFAQSWSTRLHLEAVPMLERWCRHAMDHGEIREAGAMWLHLALVYRWNDVLSSHGVSTLICAEVFLNSNFDDLEFDASIRALWGFTDTEIFELFQTSRSRVYRWLRSSTKKEQVFEHVLKVALSSQVVQQSDQAPQLSSLLGRKWQEMTKCWDGQGRFAQTSDDSPESVGPDEDFAKWLAAQVDTAAVELNMNLGQLQFCQESLKPIPKKIATLPQFQEVFPSDVPDSDSGGSNSPRSQTCFYWAMVEKSKNRERYQFPGTRFQAVLWRPTCTREHGFTRPFPQSASEGESWIVEALDKVPELCEIWSGQSAAKWFAPQQEYSGHVAKLMTIIDDDGTVGQEKTFAMK
jgi:hypothetical protein